LVTHWKSALPLATLNVQYEDLVADLEGQSRGRSILLVCHGTNEIGFMQSEDF
jgi:broad specificity phosphatase PhoE